MKRKIIIVCLLCFLLSDCYESKKHQIVFPAKTIVKTIDNIDVVVDPNVEMMNIIQRLAGLQPSFLKVSKQEPYIYKVENYFDLYKDSSAVILLKRNIMVYGSPSEFGMYLNKDDSDFIMKLEDKNFIVSYGVANKIPYFAFPEFRESVRKFRIESDFDAFFLSNTDEYEEMIERHVKILKNTNFPVWLREFYGTRQKENPCLYVTKLSGNYGISFSNPKGKIIPHVVIIDTSSDYETLHLISHEFSHPLTEEVVETLYKNNIIRSIFDKLYSKNSNVYNANGYRNGFSVLKETITQACARKFDEKNFPDDIIKQYDTWYVDSLKLIYVPAIAQFLDNYQNNRRKYKTLKSFVPELEKFILTLE